MIMNQRSRLPIVFYLSFISPPGRQTGVALQEGF